eukprot:TRINITY_DN9484_c1_g1_i1.p1 TRINITY_DN9484_c1_g1~~TRINITY_DN9484_c1_g1_i1.p1  ORF type:complete len:1011 (+),score=282.97 TRINITY_DN9484_c1_g1_i1:84-3035(+)
MDLSRVVVLCADDEAYAAAQGAALRGRDVWLGMRAALGCGDGVAVLETAPVTHGVIGESTVVVLIKGSVPGVEAPPPPQPPVAPAPPTVCVAPFARPRRSAAVVLRGCDPLEHCLGRLGGNVCCVAYTVALQLALAPGAVAVLAVGERTVGLEVVVLSEAEAGKLGGGPACLHLPPDVFANAVGQARFPDVGSAMVDGVDADLLYVVGVRGVAAAHAPAAAAAVEFRPLALPYATVGEVQPALADRCLQRHLMACAPTGGEDEGTEERDAADPAWHGGAVGSPDSLGAAFTAGGWPGMLANPGDVVTAPLPADAAAAADLAVLDVAAVLDPSAAGGAAAARAAARCVVSQAVDKDGYLITGGPFFIHPSRTRVTFSTVPVAKPPPPVLAPAGLLPVAGYAAFSHLTAFVRSIFKVGGAYSGTALLSGSGGDVDANGACALVGAAARQVGCHLLDVSAGTVDAASFRSLAVAAARAHPTVLLIRDFEAWFEKGQPKEGGDGASVDAVTARMRAVLAALEAGELEPPQPEGGTPAAPLRGIVVVAVADSAEALPPAVPGSFHFSSKVSPPDAAERGAMLAALLAPLCVSRTVTPPRLAKATAGLTCLGLAQCVATAACAAERRIADAEAFAEADARVVVQFADFSEAIALYTKSHSINVSTNIQKVSWKDIGGLKEAKEEIMQCIHLPLAHPGLFRESGLKPRRGVLMFGPPGCGKTLLAKGVATECGLNFLSVKGPEMLNMYVGESERNIRNLFEKARQASPCVVFFDELDALVPNRGAKGDSAGVMDRIVAQLLTELDSLGTDPDEFVFIIGATNRPDLIDPSLLRPGRFDRCVYLGVASSSAEQATILKAQTRKMNLDPSVNLLDVTSSMPKTYSGADMYALSTEALMLAMREKVDDLVKTVEAKRAALEAAPAAAEGSSDDGDGDGDGGDAAGGDGNGFNSVVVTQQHLEAARRTCTPSITVGDLARYNAMKEQFAATATI